MASIINDKIRNVAIIAHVDHGKTTLLDGMLKQSGIFRQDQAVSERIMDSDDQEKERGITILSKNTSIMYNDVKINIVDTPGHADFGGEVERVLKMVDGVLLLVDAFEGTMPQTRAVLKKALGLGLQPIVVVNKIDRPGANPEAALDSVLDLFIDLGADDEQLNFPVVYASGRDGVAKLDMADTAVNLTPLFEQIIEHIPAPKCYIDGPFQMLVSNIDYDEYVGRIAIGRIERGIIKKGMPIAICKLEDEKVERANITKMYVYEGLQKNVVEEAKAGEIVAISGISNINIGETVCDIEKIEKIDFVDIDEPTVSMTFSVNNGPLAGKEGKFLTSRHLRDRLYKEMERNISLKVKDTESADSFEVSGRGELHLTVLIENMRREGYELMVSRPKVIIKEINGVKHEPIERLVVDVPSDTIGSVIEKLGRRKAEMVDMKASQGDFTRAEFLVPARGLIGYRTEFMTDTRGHGTLNHIFEKYEPVKGDIQSRTRGVIVAFESGKSLAYGLFNAQDKGELLIGAGVEVYEGMIVGVNSRNEDIAINVCKAKHLTNMRSSGADDALNLTPPLNFSLEKAIEFIADDEFVEVTPESIRLRKRVLNNKDRERLSRMKSKGQI